MSTPNVHGLPQHLRKDELGYFLDYFLQEGGVNKRKRVRLGNIPLTQAKLILAQHMRAIIEHKFLGPEKPEVTFNEAAQSFLAYSKARKRTFKNDAQMVKRLGLYFGNRTLKSLNLDCVEAYIIQRREAGNLQIKGKRLANSTLNHEIATLKTIIRRAMLNNLLDRNPIAGVRMFKEEVRDRTLTPEEFQRFLQHSSPHLQAMAQLAYLTGMRRGEIFGLRWDQVDLKNRVINLAAEDTKTQEKREVPLCETLIGVFNRIPQTLGCPLVFNFKGKKIGTIKNAFLSACRRAGIEDFKFHDFRHCAVTNLRKAGVSDTVIMSISGHKTYSMFKRYNRIDREDRQDAIQQVERHNDTALTAALNAQGAQ